MRRSLAVPCILSAVALSAAVGLALAEGAKAAPKRPVVDIRTNLGTITVELWPDVAPKTVQNFVGYVLDGHFEGTIFHRVVQNFVIQGGNMTPDGQSKPVGPPIPLEAREPNKKLTIAMARTANPNSATDQFYINLADNTSLDPAVRPPGYAVFGRVIRGAEVVEAIGKKPTDKQRPLEDVVIEKVAFVK